MALVYDIGCWRNHWTDNFSQPASITRSVGVIATVPGKDVSLLPPYPFAVGTVLALTQYDALFITQKMNGQGKPCACVMTGSESSMFMARLQIRSLEHSLSMAAYIFQNMGSKEKKIHVASAKSLFIDPFPPV